MKAKVHLLPQITVHTGVMNLRAWIEHYGSSSNGHYVAYRYINGKLYLFDDSKVIEVKRYKNRTSSKLTIMLHKYS